ncbi:hypothetical protein [Pantoea sp. B65]|uniref:hypothetical protein n=1 Tax=Pantoea sp. B65 TaxID=2813359 RepID=UPI0039B46AF4
MSDIKLFRYSPQGVAELESKAAVVEKQLQALIEQKMEVYRIELCREWNATY